MRNAINFLALFPILNYGQCAMCRAVIEADQNNETAKGINDGITYLMIFPYILLAIIGIIIYKAYKKRKHLDSPRQ